MKTGELRGANRANRTKNHRIARLTAGAVAGLVLTACGSEDAPIEVSRDVQPAPSAATTLAPGKTAVADYSAERKRAASGSTCTVRAVQQEGGSGQGEPFDPNDTSGNYLQLGFDFTTTVDAQQQRLQLPPRTAAMAKLFIWGTGTIGGTAKDSAMVPAGGGKAAPYQLEATQLDPGHGDLEAMIPIGPWDAESRLTFSLDVVAATEHGDQTDLNGRSVGCAGALVLRAGRWQVDSSQPAVSAREFDRSCTAIPTVDELDKCAVDTYWI